MEKIKFDYSKLKGRIIEKCGSQKAFAEEMGMSKSTISIKLQGQTFFSQSQIFRAAKVLDIDPERIGAYFFAL